MTGCRKVMYATRDAALSGARSMVNRTGTRFAALQFYRCDHCRDATGKRAWHYGHRMGSNPVRRRVR